MAGQPDTQRRLALMRTIHADIIEWFEAGESMQRIALLASDKLEETINAALVGRYAQAKENEPEVMRARAYAADHRAERVLDRSQTLVDKVSVGLADKDDIAAARIANDADQWIAGVWNRPRYGQQNAATVTVNVGAIHLDSLRQAPAVERVRPPELEAFDVEARMVDDEPTSLDDLL